MRPRRVAILQFILSLVLALALWTFVSFTQNPTEDTTFNVPIDATDPRPELMVVNPDTGLPSRIDGTISVRVTGPRLDIAQLSQKQVEASADLTTLSAGMHIVPINVSAPRGVRVSSRQPEAVKVRLEPVVTKTFSVTQEITGQPPFATLEDDAIRIATDQVRVEGPSNQVAQVAQVRLPIDLQGRLRSYTESLPLEAVDVNGKVVPGITLSPNRTDVTVNIQPRVNVQTVSVVPQFVGQPPFPYVVEQFDWFPRSVEVIAPVVITSTLRTEPITLTNRTESFTQTVQLIDVENVVTRLENNAVTVQVQIAPLGVVSNTPLFVPTVIPRNLSPHLRASTLPTGLTVTVSGTYQQLSQLAGAVVQATVDVGGRGPGTYTLPVSLELPPGVQIVGDPPKATITLVPNTPSTPAAPAAPQASPITGGT
jgi:YbbR domain-containing protein